MINVNFLNRKMTIQEQITHFTKLLSSLPSQEKRYDLLIEMGKHLPELEEKHITKKNKIEACQSNTYIHTYLEKGKLRIE